MEALKAGDVVYLRGDKEFKDPMTVRGKVGENQFDLVWLPADKALVSCVLPRECLMTEVDAHADEIERQKKKAELREQAMIRRPYAGPGNY